MNLADAKHIFNNLRNALKTRPSKVTSEQKNQMMLQNAYNRVSSLLDNKASGVYRGRSNYLPGADQGPLRNEWDNSSRTNTSLIYESYPTLVNRSEQMFRTNPFAIAARRILLDYTVGEGLKPFPAVKDSNGEMIDSVNKKLKQDWDRYDEENVRGTPAYGTTSEYYQRVCLGTIIDTGNILSYKVPSKKGSMLPEAISFIKPQRLNWDNDTYKNVLQSSFESGAIKESQIIHGIKLNKYAEPMGYYVDSNDNFISSDKMQLFFLQTELEQYLAFPWISGGINYLYDVDDLLQDRIYASRLIEKIGIWIKKEDKQDFLSNLNSDGRVDWSNAQIMSTRHEPKVIQSNDKVAETFGPLMRIYLHAIASSFGFSYIRFTKDLDKVNFASTRYNSVNDDKFFMNLFHWYKKTIPDYTWKHYVEQQFTYGRMPGGYSAIQYQNNSHKYNNVYWLPSGVGWVDPLKDNQALKLAHDEGWMTLQEICALKGKDWKDTLRNYKAEKDFLKEHGLDEFIAKPEGEKLIKDIEKEDKGIDDSEEQDDEERYFLEKDSYAGI